MSAKMLIKFNQMKKTYAEGTKLDFVNRAVAQEANQFHRKCENYHPTSLISLPHLSQKLGVQAIYVKNEGERFGLNAFKGLGGSFAVGKYLAQKLGRDINELSFAELASPEVKAQIGDITLVTATDGNHGRGVAWAAEQLGLKAVVLMPKGSSEIRAQNIRNHGAQCTITDLNYDDAVRMANRLAQENGWVILQDTAWDGYEEIPTWIMQGYLTLANEAFEQLPQLPTHIILQAGVGSFAGAIMGFFVEQMKENMPKIIVVEPHQANCLYQSACANDNLPHNVGGDMQTIMAGLACGEPNTVSWPIIRDYADVFISADDQLAANGMRIAAAPRPHTDPAYISGESGAIGLGLLYELKSNTEYQSLCRQLELDENARVFMVSTEGDTSPDIYEQIVWLGRNK
ncbi:diaminopropionate ammonia-lyase [Aggregatibacter kilianii]|uniref:diaminopropionate ammonia-lyase n=1 Tax=Aggregatibacter kilianii TaxID=2025884 RepID=UPI000D64B262|nr:diaminopropionate ammonia-lyase [Aggregatibacter kilianii]